MTTTETPAEQPRCQRCGRKMRVTTDPYGPKCAAKIRKAQLDEARADFTPAQQAKADELIRDGGIVQVAPGLYEVASSDGGHTYATDGHSCTCDAGWADKRCYHLLAVRIMELASRRPLRKSSLATAA
jgi:hypothetical protein